MIYQRELDDDAPQPCPRFSSEHELLKWFQRLRLARQNPDSAASAEYPAIGMVLGRRASVQQTLRESRADMSSLDATLQFGPNQARPKSMIQRLFGRKEETIEVKDEATEMEIWLLREKVYSLSSTLGNMEARIQLTELSDALRSWRESKDDRPRQQMIAKHIETTYGYDGVLVVTDMSGFTRVTREEGILHFMMLIKQMQAICVPIFERFGGRLVKVEADDLFIVFPGQRSELAIRAVLRCMRACNEFSLDKPKNSQIVIAAGVIAGPMYQLPGLDVFGGVVPLGFRIGEDEAPNGVLYVHESVKDRLDRMGEEGMYAPSKPLVFEEAATIEGDMCDGRQHKLYTVKVGQGAVGEEARSMMLGYDVQSKKGRRDGSVARPRFGRRSRASKKKVTPTGTASRSKPHGLIDKAVEKVGEAIDDVREAAEEMGLVEEQKELMLLRRARLKPKWCVTNSVINSEEPQELMLMMSERMQCMTPEARSYCDKQLLERFARSSAAVMVVVVDMERPSQYDAREQEIFCLGMLLHFKEFAQQATNSMGGSCMTAVQKRTFPAAFCIMPSCTAAFEALVMIFKWAQKPGRFPEGAISLRAGVAFGELLDFGGNNAFGDPVNTAFKLAEDVATPWEILVQERAYEQIMPEKTSLWGFEQHQIVVSHVTLTYEKVLWLSAKAKEVAEQLDLIVLVAQSNTQAIDWSKVIELDVLMLPHHGISLRKDTSSEAIEELRGAMEIMDHPTTRGASFLKRNFRDGFADDHRG